MMTCTKDSKTVSILTHVTCLKTEFFVIFFLHNTWLIFVLSKCTHLSKIFQKSKTFGVLYVVESEMFWLKQFTLCYIGQINWWFHAYMSMSNVSISHRRCRGWFISAKVVSENNSFHHDILGLKQLCFRIYWTINSYKFVKVSLQIYIIVVRNKKAYIF